MKYLHKFNENKQEVFVGKNGDNYIIKLISRYGDVHVAAYTTYDKLRNGELAAKQKVGHLYVTKDKKDGYYYAPSMSVFALYVDENHRRNGLATAMQDFVESLGYKLKPSELLSDEAQALWNKRLNENIDPAYVSKNKNDFLELIAQNIEKGWEEYEYEEYLDNLVKSINDLKKEKEIILYRVIWANNIEDIRTKNLGLHYCKTLESYHEDMLEALYETNDFDDTYDFIEDLWYMKVKVPTKDINYNETLLNNLKFPYEEEVTLLQDDNVKVIYIDKYYN